MNDIGMPQLKIAFEALGLSAIRRSERGIALLILKEVPGAMKDQFSHTYGTLMEVPGVLDPGFEYVEQEVEDPAGGGTTTELVKVPKELPYTYSEKNLQLLKLAFDGAPYKLRVEVFDGEARTLADILDSLELARFSYYAYPEQTPEEQDIILSWHRDIIRRKDKTIVFVGYEEAADDRQWLNWSVPWVVHDGVRYEGAEYTAIIATSLAGLSLSRSYTSYDFYGEIDEAPLPFAKDEDLAVNQGKLFLTWDGETYKIARGVNSLVTYSDTVRKDFSKIRIVEAQNIIKNDIKDTFSKEYAGKIINTPDNKDHFIAMVNRIYFPSLYGSLLSEQGQNFVDINMAAHRNVIIERGGEPENMEEQAIRDYNVGSFVYLAGKVSILDAMEDLDIIFHME